MESLEIITPIRGRKLAIEVGITAPLSFRNNNPDKGTETWQGVRGCPSGNQFRNNNPDKGTETSS